MKPQPLSRCLAPVLAALLACGMTACKDGATLRSDTTELRAEFKRKQAEQHTLEQQIESLAQRENKLTSNASGSAKIQDLEDHIARLEADSEALKIQDSVAQQAQDDAARRTANYTAMYPLNR